MLDRMWERCIGNWERVRAVTQTLGYMARERETWRRLPRRARSMLWRCLLFFAFWRGPDRAVEVTETITIGDSDRPTMGSRTEYRALVINPAWPRDLETVFRPLDPQSIPPDAVFSDLGRVGATGLGTPMLIIGRGSVADPELEADGLVKWPRHPVTLRTEWAELQQPYFYMTIGDIYRSSASDFEPPNQATAVQARTRELVAVGNNGQAPAEPGQVQRRTETEADFLHHVMEMDAVMSPPQLTPTEYGMDLAMAPLERRHSAALYGDLADKITSSYKWALGVMVLAIVAIMFIRSGTG